MSSLGCLGCWLLEHHPYPLRLSTSTSSSTSTSTSLSFPPFRLSKLNLESVSHSDHVQGIPHTHARSLDRSFVSPPPSFLAGFESVPRFPNNSFQLVSLSFLSGWPAARVRSPLSQLGPNPSHPIPSHPIPALNPPLPPSRFCTSPATSTQATPSRQTDRQTDHRRTISYQNPAGQQARERRC
ncbi:hypothetical protein BKA65DRAFT_107941 [Rhexocercosporidium sp. MPI-PUGE-AT-0058]|nr:hypothetical protein BKA65DRAFT_107941 [Rhexocercosporidium sp. MPI-PUGE-AT-0058]